MIIKEKQEERLALEQKFRLKEYSNCIAVSL